MPNKDDVPRISVGNWICHGSLLYIPPTPKKAPVKAKASPKQVEPPKEEQKEEEPPKEEPKDDTPVTVSEGTDSPEDILKKAREIVAQAEAEARKAEEEAKKMEDEESAKKAAEEEAAKKEADEEAAKKKEEDDAAAKKKEEEEEAAMKKEEEEAAARKKEEDDAAAKLKEEEEDAAKKKALDEKIERLKKEKELMMIEHAKKKLLKDLAKEMAKGEQNVRLTGAVSVGRFCSMCGRRSHEGECDDTPPERASNSLPVVHVNVYGGAEDAVKITGDKDGTITTKKADDTGVAVKTDDEDKSDTNLDMKPADNSKFTTEQDEKLLSLRSSNATWANISKELGFDKKACAQRYKELIGKAASTASSSKESLFPKSHVDLSEVIAVSGDTVIVAGPQDDAPKSNDGDKNKKGDGSDAGSNKSQKSGNYKKPTVEDASKRAEAPNKDQSNNNANNNNTVPPFNSCPPSEPRTYMPIPLSATIPLSGGRRILLPVSTWTISDLECLAELECRYRELKWMKISADFFNHTGRMIDPRIIEAKFGEAGTGEDGKAEKEGEQGKETEGKEGIWEGKGKGGEVNEVQFKVRLDKMREQGVIPDELEFRISKGKLQKSMEGGGGGKIDV